MKKKTQLEQMKETVTEAINDVAGNQISHCSFVGVQYDAKAVESITTIAEGLKQNAIALGKLAEVLNSSNVEIESMVKFD